jgi:hypothetical protein
MGTDMEPWLTRTEWADSPGQKVEYRNVMG